MQVLPILLTSFLLGLPAIEVEPSMFPEGLRDELMETVDGASVVCSLPETRVEAGPEVVGWWMDRLAFAGAVVRRLGWEGYKIDDLPDGAVHVSDGKGLEAILELVAQQPDRRVYHGRGRYALVRKAMTVSAEAVVAVQWKAADDGSLIMWGRVWVKLDNGVLHQLGKVISPLLSRAISRKAAKFIRVATRLCNGVAEDPERLYHRAIENNEGVTEEERAAYLERFLSGTQSLKADRGSADR